MADFKSIVNLFDLPGAETEAGPSIYRDREGRDASQSTQYGNASMLEGDYMAAIMHFKAALSQGGNREEILFSLGAAYEACDLAPQAFRQYEKAKAATSNGELFTGLATLYRQYGRSREAVGQLEAAILKEPTKSFHHFKLAEMLRQMGYRTNALSAIQGAVSLAPEDPFYHYWMGDLLIEMGRFDEAAKALQASLELSPGDDFVLEHVGLALWAAGRRAEALRAIRLASDLDNEKLVYYGILERFLREEGLIEEANQELKYVQKMDRYDHDLLSRALKRVGMHHQVPDEEQFLA